MQRLLLLAFTTGAVLGHFVVAPIVLAPPAQGASSTRAHARGGRVMPPIMDRIRACESGKRTKHNKPILHTYDYRAANRHSSASGGWQFLDSTWHGYGGFHRARDAPRALQDRRAMIEYRRNGTSPWTASSDCWG